MAARSQAEEGEEARTDVTAATAANNNNVDSSSAAAADADSAAGGDGSNKSEMVVTQKECDEDTVLKEVEDEVDKGGAGKVVVINLNPRSGDGNHLEDQNSEDAKEPQQPELLNLGVAKARGDVDQWVKFLDDTDPSHRLRSLCKTGNLEELQAFLESNNPDVDINAVSEEGWTCLHEIITHECQFTDVARILLRFGANVNTQDLHGDTPLHSALLYHNENILLLLENGADLSLVNVGGRMPIHVADEAETMKLLLKHHAKVDAQDKIGNTALHYAVVARDKQRIEALLSASANLNIQNRSGSTPLHLANDSDLAQLLLDSGADPNLIDINANTPLHLAVRGRHKDVVRLLLERKADSSLINIGGKTPVALAKDREMRQILMGKVASATTPSSTTTPSTSAAAPVIKRTAKKSSIGSYVDKLMEITSMKCTSPSILKRRRSCSEPSSPPRKGPRLRFSDVNDYRGVEVVEEVRRVRVTPIYSEPQFSSDDD